MQLRSDAALTESSFAAGMYQAYAMNPRSPSSIRKQNKVKFRRIKGLRAEHKNNWGDAGGPNGIRIRVYGLKGRCPSPLDDGATGVRPPTSWTRLFPAGGALTRGSWPAPTSRSRPFLTIVVALGTCGNVSDLNVSCQPLMHPTRPVPRVLRAPWTLGH